MINFMFKDNKTVYNNNNITTKTKFIYEVVHKFVSFYVNY